MSRQRGELGMRLERWLHAWDVFLLIMFIGLLTGLITFMVTDTHPAACRHTISHTAGRMHIPVRSATWVCQHP